MNDTSAIFLENLLKLMAGFSLQEDPWRSFRTKAWDHFLELGLPEKKGDFQYLPLSKLYEESWSLNTVQPILSQEEIASLVLPECQRSYIVLVNGVLRLDLSDIRGISRSVSVYSLKDAARLYGAFLQARFAKMLKEETSPFVILNAALHQGAFIMVPAKAKIEAPLQCLEIITSSEKPKAVFPRVHMVLGAEAELSLVMSASSLEEKGKYYSNAALDFSLEEGAKLHIASSKQHAASAFVLDSLRAVLKKGSEIDIVSTTSGSPLFHEDYQVALSQERAKASLKSLAFLSGSSQMHLQVCMQHLAPHTESTQLIKAALKDTSKSNFTGKIFVSPEAQKTQAYQLNNNLLLGEYAAANSKPNLEIFADDVKASHGATFAQLDPQQLFYLKSRGLGDEAARGLLLNSFCDEVVSSLFLDSLRIEALQKVEELSQGAYVEAPL